MFSWFKTWWIILRISLEERLVYRGDFALGTLMRFAPIVTQIFLWDAIFEAVKASGTKNNQIVGYSYHDMVAYYLLVMIGRAFSKHARIVLGHRPRHTHRSCEKISHTTHRHAGFFAALPHGAQAGVLWGGSRAFCPGVFSCAGDIFPAGPTPSHCWRFSLRL